jgi:hypothetical protein
MPARPTSRLAGILVPERDPLDQLVRWVGHAICGTPNLKGCARRAGSCSRAGLDPIVDPYSRRIERLDGLDDHAAPKLGRHQHARIERLGGWPDRPTWSTTPRDSPRT